MRRYAIIADDLTGATDAGAAFARVGFRVDVAMCLSALPRLQAEVVAITTNSRHDSPALARAKVQRACRALRKNQRELIYKKLDSTAQGNIVAEVQAARVAAGFDIALVCPANPGQGRLVRRSVLHVRDQDYGSLLDRFRSQGLRNPGVLELPLELELAHATLAGKARFIISDAAVNRDLKLLIRAALEGPKRVLLAGSAGMAAALASALRSGPDFSSQVESGEVCRPTSLPVLVLCGTRNPLTLAQVDELLKHDSCERFQLADCTWAGLQSAFVRGRHAVIHLPVHLAPEGELRRVLQQFETLLIEKRVGGLLLTGGDTALLACRWLKMRSLALHGEILPGLAWGFARGGLADGLIVCTKPGGFGDPASLGDALWWLTKNSPTSDPALSAWHRRGVQQK